MVKVTLEKDVPFSESLLWKLQQQAYTEFGVSAWREKGVPSYLTTHPMTARGYAKTALAFLFGNKKPITLIDLGAGTGRFAYLFLEEFLPHVSEPVCYLYTDISSENLNFIKEHPFMEPYSSMLTPVLYRHDDKEWDAPSFEGPVIVISNYYFDTVPQSLYKFEDGVLYEGKVTTVVEEEYAHLGVQMLPHVECSYTYTPAHSPLLEQYGACLKEGTFVVPALETIEFIRSQTKGPLLWITADQAVVTRSQALNFREPKIARHGTFSVTVSYHFLHWYFQEHLNGSVITMENPDPAYAVMAMALNANCDLAAKAFKEMPEPIDYYRLGLAIDESASLDTLMALIQLGSYDPINTHFYFEAIRSKMREADVNQKNRLIYLLERVQERFYPISKEEGEFLMNLGVLFFELEAYRQALHCFEQSLLFTGPSMKAQLNIAACTARLTKS